MVQHGVSPVLLVLLCAEQEDGAHLDEGLCGNLAACLSRMMFSKGMIMNEKASLIYRTRHVLSLEYVRCAVQNYSGALALYAAMVGQRRRMRNWMLCLPCPVQQVDQIFPYAQDW